MDINNFFTRPIPDLEVEKARKDGFRAERIDRSNPLFSEECIDLVSIGIAGENHYYRKDNPPYYQSIPGSIPELLARKTVAGKLSEANILLNDMSLELYVFDAYRPIAVQNYFFDVWFPGYLKTSHPDWSAEKIEDETGKYWSRGAKDEDSVDLLSPPPHNTGAAIDLTIRNKRTKEHLFMGTIFDDGNESAHADYLEKVLHERSLSLSEGEALRNRRLLFWVMNEVGMHFNPFEWWHFSYGDQLWARFTGNTAVYGAYIKPKK